jgi:acetolactate synthase-1/2/3 large subunit
MRIADYIVEELIRLGVTHVFTLHGGFSMYLNDSVSHSSLVPVYCLNESGAGFAACGHSQYTGKLGVVIVTSGPGSTNLITPVASAWDDSIPLLVISGEAKLDLVELRTRLGLRIGGPQDVDINRVVRPIVKYVNVVENSIGARYVLKEAVRYAMTDRRGPAWVILPLDIAGSEYVGD